MLNRIPPESRRKFIRRSAISAAVFPFLFSCGESIKISHSSAIQQSIKKLKSGFKGQIILPGDINYESKRWSRVINATMDKYPMIIAACKTETDVLKCVEFGKENNLEIAVRSGNHSSLGWGTCQKGIVIDLSEFKGVSVDPKRRTAIVSTGATADEILAASAPFGLAPVLGQCGSVGSGISLGGGLGWLAGKYGAACDNVISARVITADLEIRQADSVNNPDLFWAIRGGGGNFGIVTSIEYTLHPVDVILAGSLFYSFNDARDVFKYFLAFMSHAPDDLQADYYITNDKCWVEIVYSGDMNIGERLLDNFIKFIKPESSSIKRRPFSEVYRMSDDSFNPPKFNSEKGIYLDQLTDQVIESVMNELSRVPGSCNAYFNVSHFMHGEVCRIKPDATAFDLRKPGAAHLAFWITWWDPVDSEACIAWHNEAYEQLNVYSAGRIYANYMSIPGGSNAKAVFGNNFARLLQAKNKYDPDNIFHLNQNIIPG